MGVISSIDLPSKKNRAAPGPENAKHHLDQRGLAAAIGAQKGNDFSLFDGHINIGQYRCIGIGKGYVLGPDQLHFLHPFPAFLNITAKIGMPNTDVRMPMGISTGNSSLEKLSAISKKMAPTKTQIGNNNR